MISVLDNNAEWGTIIKRSVTNMWGDTTPYIDYYIFSGCKGKWPDYTYRFTRCGGTLEGWICEDKYEDIKIKRDDFYVGYEDAFGKILEITHNDLKTP